MSKSLTQEDFITSAISKHGVHYDYSQTIYTKAHDKIKIGCPIHGVFIQKAYAHLNYGCKQCGNERSGKNRASKLIDFITRANKIHDNRYDYRLVDFARQHQKINILCPIHGLFLQAVNDHLKGHGCNRCGRILVGQFLSKTMKSTTVIFLEKCIRVHGDRYDLSEVTYSSAKIKVRVICLIHGAFEILPNNLLAGYGCAVCGMQIRHMQNAWLDSLGVHQRECLLNVKGRRGKRFSVDGFDSETNTVYEFYGDFWHGNPRVFAPDQLNKVIGKTFGAMYSKTLDRAAIISAAGYRLVEIWEDDWKRIHGKESQGEIHSKKPTKVYS